MFSACARQTWLYNTRNDALSASAWPLGHLAGIGGILYRGRSTWNLRHARRVPSRPCSQHCRSAMATFASVLCPGRTSTAWLAGRVTPPATSRSTCGSGGMSRPERDDLFRVRQGDPSRITLVADHASQPCIGYLGLVEIDWSRRLIGNMGYRIHPSWCDRGIGTRFMRAASAWCFSHGIQVLRLDVGRRQQPGRFAVTRKLASGGPGSSGRRTPNSAAWTWPSHGTKPCGRTCARTGRCPTCASTGCRWKAAETRVERRAKCAAPRRQCRCCSPTPPSHSWPGSAVCPRCIRGTAPRSTPSAAAALPLPAAGADRVYPGRRTHGQPTW